MHRTAEMATMMDQRVSKTANKGDDQNNALSHTRARGSYAFFLGPSSRALERLRVSFDGDGGLFSSSAMVGLDNSVRFGVVNADSEVST